MKDNQLQLCQDIATLFEAEHCVKGFSPAVKEFRTATTIEQGHGRLERRTLTASDELKGYLDWPYAEQVFKLERHCTRLADGQVMEQVVYGTTSLTKEEAGAERLLDCADALAD